MKILFVNQAYHPDASASAQHLTDLATDLAAGGAKVTVLCARQGYVNSAHLYPEQETVSGVQVRRIGLRRGPSGGRIRRMADALLMNLAFARTLRRIDRPDVIVAMTTPPLVGWIAGRYAKRHKIRFVYWVLDLSLEEAVRAGWFKEKSLLIRTAKKLFGKTLERADRVVTPDRWMQRTLSGYGVSESKVRVIPPGILKELVPVPHALNPIRKDLGGEGRFVVMYAGNHSVCHPLETLLAAAERLQEEKEILFVFAGGGARREQTERHVRSRAMTNVVFLPYQERAELSRLLSAADLHAVVLGDAFVGAVHPSKVYGAMAVGRPFVYIGPEGYETPAQTLIENGADGYRAVHGQPDALAEIIRDARRKSKNVSERQQAIAAAAHRVHGPALITASWKQVLDDVDRN